MEDHDREEERGQPELLQGDLARQQGEQLRSRHLRLVLLLLGFESVHIEETYLVSILQP